MGDREQEGGSTCAVVNRQRQLLQLSFASPPRPMLCPLHPASLPFPSLTDCQVAYPPCCLGSCQQSGAALASPHLSSALSQCLPNPGTLLS